MRGVAIRFANSSPEDVLVFVYHLGHGPYWASIDDPNLHLFVFADADADADAEALVPADQTVTLRHPRGPSRLIGVGQADVSDWAALSRDSALPMQGWADICQTTMGVESGLHNKPAPQKARAFIIADADSQTRAVMVICTYANGYASYITTAEEYDVPQDEGASNLYGRQALRVFCDGLSTLGQHIAGTGRAPRHDAPLRDPRGRVLMRRRMAVLVVAVRQGG